MNIEHDLQKKEFWINVDGCIARLNYRLADGALDVYHTIVPDEIAGRGIASALVRVAYDYALVHHLIPVATCSYAVKWLEKHSEYKGRIGMNFTDEEDYSI